ncbi:MAG: TetR/AcrR family transcriptional regulator [Candidatus Limnocylindria bacterium]
MEEQAKRRARRRVPVTRERVLAAAMALADEGGIESLTMRKVGQALGVEAMALYRHVTNKDDIIDGMVDIVFSEIDVTAADDDWKAAMRKRAFSVREALSRHRWAVGLMESRRNPGPANLRHHDAVLGNLRAAGFDMAMAAHVYPVLDSYIYGFAMTQMNLPFENTADIAEVAQSMLQAFPVNEYPNLAAFITEHAMKPGYDHGNEFAWGLDIILDGLERMHNPV